MEFMHETARSPGFESPEHIRITDIAATRTAGALPPLFPSTYQTVSGGAPEYWALNSKATPSKSKPGTLMTHHTTPL